MFYSYFKTNFSLSKFKERPRVLFILQVRLEVKKVEKNETVLTDSTYHRIKQINETEITYITTNICFGNVELEDSSIANIDW